jgi:hypothetical protein
MNIKLEFFLGGVKGNWGLNSRPCYIRLVLYHMSHIPVSFCIIYFQVGSLVLCPGWPQIMLLLSIPPMQLGSQACTTMPSLFVENGVFCPGWPQIAILLIRAFQAGGIIVTSHHVGLNLKFFTDFCFRSFLEGEIEA